MLLAYLLNVCKALPPRPCAAPFAQHPLGLGSRWVARGPGRTPGIFEDAGDERARFGEMRHVVLRKPGEEIGLDVIVVDVQLVQ